jgi:hypothetical protein
MGRTILAFLLIASGLAQGQAMHSISGVVVDIDGKPVRGARIDHGGRSLTGFGPSTGEDGRFTLRTGAPAVVVRKPGYQGYRLLTSADAVVRVVLQPAKPTPVTYGKDVDYAMTVETVNTPSGKVSVRDGQGPT